MIDNVHSRLWTAESMKGDDLEVTLADMMKTVMSEMESEPFEGILHHEEGVDLVPSNLELSSLEVSLVNAMNREYTLKRYLEQVKQEYDYILIRRYAVAGNDYNQCACCGG